MPQVTVGHFNDPRAQQFVDMWVSRSETATSEHKDRVGVAYISHVMGLGDEIAERFAQYDGSVWGRVGLRQSWSPDDPFERDLRGFWENINEIFPGLHTEEDIAYLVDPGEWFAAFEFLFEMSRFDVGALSSVLQRLLTNAHAYK